jgi:hypothetical protein
MIPDLTVASFYTPTWRYPEHAARLRWECDRLGLPHHIAQLPDQGGYLANTRLKPGFLRDTMLELARPLLWVDVDGSILARPDALRADADFMAHPMPARTGLGRVWNVGTLFFNSTPAALDLLTLWAEATGAGSDEAALDVVWRSARWEGLFAPLPTSYYRILPPGGVHIPPGTVIAHRLSTSPSKIAMKKRQAAKRAAASGP